jgi:mitogen-activated protein kinase kinase kinase
MLKEMGIKKIGDRIRIHVAIKALRTKVAPSQRQRNRETLADLENLGGPQYSTAQYTPSSSGSPRHTPTSKGSGANRRHSRQIMDYNPPTAVPFSSRPGSPAIDADGTSRRTPRHVLSPMETARANAAGNYFGGGLNTATYNSNVGDGGPRTARLATHTKNPSIDGSIMGSLPTKMQAIRVIGSGGQTKVVKVVNCKTSEEIIKTTIKKFNINEALSKNYCFYVLDGLEPDPINCHRINDAELVRICADPGRQERNRLILRKIHAGEPEDGELQRAAEIAAEEVNSNYLNAVANTSARSQLKLQKLTGEPWEAVQSPLSPASFQFSQAEREQNVNFARQELERPAPQEPGTPGPAGVGYRKRGAGKNLKSFFGARPPSELISSNLTAYFPDHQKDEIEKTVRMSIRRSQRLSRATSRLSIASNMSFSSSMKDAPPIPSIADNWLTAGAGAPPSKGQRPLSMRFGSPQGSYRDSVASSMLEPLAEENSPLENRKSYMSFASESSPDRPDINVTISDTDGTISNSYYDETAGSTPITEGGDSLNATLSQAIAEDGEEPDAELTQFLDTDNWDNIKYMKGAMIGQGSFGSVYLALHSITGELMAVKQVEMPSAAGAIDSKKKSMIDALKREIGLLREMQHPNIVQYLGSSSDEEHLNIFLEYVPGGSVAQMLNQYGALQEPLVRNFVRQILTGLAYLHGRDIIHRDIKGANVLVDNKGGIKISDFGISKRVEASTLLTKGAANRPSLQGSVFWMAPEVVKQTSYTRKADIWSLGCLIVEMLTGNHPYPDLTQLQAIFKIGSSSASPTVPDEVSAEGKAFLAKTFDIDHTKRPNADELLLDPFLNSIA